MSPTRRSSTPAPGSIRSFDFPAVSADRLPNGLEMRVVENHTLPIVTVSLVLDGGEATLDEQCAGWAVLTGDSLEGGTAQRSGTELAEAQESTGAGLSVGTGWDGTTISLSCLPDRLDAAMDLLAEVVMQPGFPADEVERVRAQRLAAIEHRRIDPSSVATDAACRVIYADGIPYGRPVAGSLNSVSRFDSEAARRFWGAHYRPGAAGLIIVGDIDPDETRTLTERCFGDWRGNAPSGRRFEAKPRSRERRVVIVDRPGAVQSELRIGHVGQPRSTPEYFPLMVFNTVLGGVFTSRLNLNLRERHGFTYGVRSAFSFRRAAGPWTIVTAVSTDVTAKAVQEVLGEVETLLSEGPTTEEMEAARDYRAGVFPLRLETTGQVATQIAQLITYNLPDDYHATYRDRIREVTRDQAVEAAQRCVRPDEIAVVVCGDARAVRAPLEALELGPVEVRSTPSSG